MAAESYVVNDKYDPSGQGMFSSAGRFTTEKYIIFQRKDEILYNKKITKSASQPLFPNQGQGTKQFKAKELKNEKLDKNTPFDRQTSRQYIQQLQAIKHPTKPVGYYQPKYKEVDKNLHMLWDIRKVYNSQTIPIKTYIPPDTLQEDLERPIPEKALRKVTGLIELDRCIDKDEKTMYNVKGNPHEARFEPYTLSQAWSNITPSVQMNLYKGRDNMLKAKEHQPDYNPNYEFGRKQLGTSGPDHKTKTGRRPFHYTSSTNNEDRYDFDAYVKPGGGSRSQIWRKQKLFDVDKLLPREIDEQSRLPCFMQKHINSRANLTGLHRKMLEQNHYMDGRFQSTASDFGRSHIKFNKNDRKLDEDEESIEIDNQQQ